MKTWSQVIPIGLYISWINSIWHRVGHVFYIVQWGCSEKIHWTLAHGLALWRCDHMTNVSLPRCSDTCPVACHQWLALEIICHLPMLYNLEPTSINESIPISLREVSPEQEHTQMTELASRNSKNNTPTCAFTRTGQSWRCSKINSLYFIWETQRLVPVLFNSSMTASFQCPPYIQIFPSRLICLSVTSNVWRSVHYWNIIRLSLAFLLQSFPRYYTEQFCVTVWSRDSPCNIVTFAKFVNHPSDICYLLSQISHLGLNWDTHALLFECLQLLDSTQGWTRHHNRVCDKFECLQLLFFLVHPPLWLYHSNESLTIKATNIDLARLPSNCNGKGLQFLQEHIHHFKKIDEVLIDIMFPLWVSVMESELSELWCAPKKLNDFLSRCDSMKIEFCKRAVQPTNEMMDIKGCFRSSMGSEIQGQCLKRWESEEGNYWVAFGYKVTDSAVGDMGDFAGVVLQAERIKWGYCQILQCHAFLNYFKKGQQDWDTVNPVCFQLLMIED